MKMTPKAIKTTGVATEKRRRKRTITAFSKGRTALHPNELTKPIPSSEKPAATVATLKDKPKDKPKDKEAGKKDKTKDKGKEKERKAAKGH